MCIYKLYGSSWPRARVECERGGCGGADSPISFLNDVASYWPYGGFYVCVCVEGERELLHTSVPLVE